MEIEMVQKERIRTKRPGRCVTFGRTGVRRPLSGRCARTLLPPHWTAKQDADALTEIREEMRMLEELGGYCPMRSIFW